MLLSVGTVSTLYLLLFHVGTGGSEIYERVAQLLVVVHNPVIFRLFILLFIIMM